MRDAEFLDFPLREYERRINLLRKKMENEKISAILLTNRDNVEYISGFTTTSWRLHIKRFWLVVPLEREPVLSVDIVHEVNAEKTSWIEDLRIWGKGGSTAVDHLVQTFKDLGLKNANVGMELGNGPLLHMTANEYLEILNRLGTVRFVDANELLASVRMVKSPLEIERIRKACDLTCIGFSAGIKSLTVGMSERDLLSVIVREFLLGGGDTAYNSTNHGYLSVQSGRIFQMTPSPCDRKIQKGDLIQIDGGAVFRGYTADIYRNAYIGFEPPKVLKEYDEGGRTILKATLDSIKPGITSAEIASSAENAIQEIGFNDKRRTLMDSVSAKQGSMIGHGLGLSLHELPFITLSDNTAWEIGMCGSVEFGFGDSVNGYIHCEDNFLVTENGCDVLTPLNNSIQVVG